MNEKIATVQGKWEEANIKVQGFDSEIKKCPSSIAIDNSRARPKKIY